MEDQVWDAIVVGSGITGGWAAKELTERGLRVLMVERGRPVEHIKDYTTFDNPPGLALGATGVQAALDHVKGLVL